MAGRSLSGQAKVTVLARISMSGTPEQHAGDIVGQADWDKASAKPLTIVIDTRDQVIAGLVLLAAGALAVSSPRPSP